MPIISVNTTGFARSTTTVARKRAKGQHNNATNSLFEDDFFIEQMPISNEAFGAGDSK